MEKICTKCKQLKPITCFSRYKAGYKPACKSCYSLQEKARRIVNGGTNRINRSTETIDLKLCTKCLQLKPRNTYTNTSWCHDCSVAAQRIKARSNGIVEKFIPIIIEGSKQCINCKLIKTLDNFSNSKRGRLGKSAYCKPCNSLLQTTKYSTKEERRLKTQNYRTNNQDWHKFLHRLTQFNRKAIIKASSDGTVTKEFMFNLYSTEVCYYCNNVIIKENRTCEHKLPLNRGGIHGISNLVMACLSCNCSKGNKTETEFENYLILRNEQETRIRN